MKQHLEDIALRAFRLHLPIYKLCAHAGIAPSTWSRWRNGDSQPSQSKIDQLKAALDELEAQSEEAA